MKIVEYSDKYIENVRDLLVELEEYIVSIDEDNLDRVGEGYREKMVLYDLEEIRKNSGKCYLAIEEEKVLGLIMGIIVKYEEVDYLDYKCPKSGRVTELVVTSSARGKGVGKLLMDKMEEYFMEEGCEYIHIDVFAYNLRAMKFYGDLGYHSRMHDVIKKIV